MTSRTRIAWPLLLLVCLVIGCSGGPRGEATSTDTDGPLPVLPPGVVAPSATPEISSSQQPSGSIPQLTDADRDQVRQIAAADTRLLALATQAVGDVAAAVASGEVILWHNGPEIIGGVLTVRLPAPSEIGGEWLASVWLGEHAAPGQPLHQPVRYRATLGNVTGFRVRVDLQQEAVAGIEPDGFDTTIIEEPEYLDPIPDVPRSRH